MGNEGHIFLWNNSTGCRFEPVGFIVDPDGVDFKVRKIWDRSYVEGSGFGAFVWKIKFGFPRKVFVAVYLVKGIWKCSVDGEIFSFSDFSFVWRKFGFSGGGVGLAELKITGKERGIRLTYLRPWLRYMGETMWSLDDIDIGATACKFMTDEAARERFAKQKILGT